MAFESFAQTNTFRLGDGVRGPMNTGGTISVFLNNTLPVVGVQFTLVNKPGLLSVAAVHNSEGTSAVFDVVDFNNLSGDTFFDPQVTLFEEISKAAGFEVLFELPGRGAFASAWPDYDLDGDMDLLYLSGFNIYSTLFRNNGDKTFRNVTQETGMNIITNVVWIDFDNDGDLEPINDESQLRNDNGVFTDLTGTTGIDNRGGGFTSWGDYDNDQDLDLFINGNSGISVLYRNNGNDSFTDVTSTAGVAVAESRSSTWADFDNDADIDLFVTRPSMIDSPYVLFRNKGDGTFTDIA